MKKFLGSLALLLLPGLLFAQALDLSNGDFLTGISSFINKLIPFVIGVAVLVFIFGLLRYVTAGGDPDKIKEARNTIILGIVIIFIMTSVWGLVRILSNTIGLNNNTVQIPNQVPTGSQ